MLTPSWRKDRHKKAGYGVKWQFFTSSLGEQCRQALPGQQKNVLRISSGMEETVATT